MSLVFEKLESTLEQKPLREPGRLWRKLQKSLGLGFTFSRDFFWSIMNGGSLVREVAPGRKPLQRYEFDSREQRYDWSSRG